MLMLIYKMTKSEFIFDGSEHQTLWKTHNYLGWDEIKKHVLVV